MTEDIPTVWIDILSDPAVRLAARAWNKDLPETWGILSRAIKAEDVSQFMPLTQFDLYISLFAPKPAITPDPPQISPPTKPRTLTPPNAEGRQPSLLDKLFDAVSTPLAILFWIGFIIFFISFSFSFTNSTYDVPEPTDIREGDYEEHLYKFPTPEPDEPYYFNEPEQTDSTTPCLIKGNISYETGEKIYHLPGQEFYAKTDIDTSKGERYFCTEQEAQAAGFRKSRQ